MKGAALSSYTLILLKILPYKAFSFFLPSEIIFFAFVISVRTGLFSGSSFKARLRSIRASSGKPGRTIRTEIIRTIKIMSW